jgi:hypothetical protein
MKTVCKKDKFWYGKEKSTEEFIAAKQTGLRKI